MYKSDFRAGIAKPMALRGWGRGKIFGQKSWEDVSKGKSLLSTVLKFNLVLSV